MILKQVTEVKKLFITAVIFLITFSHRLLFFG